MPKHSTIVCGPNGWMPASDGAVAAARIQCLGKEPAMVQATLTNSPPESSEGALWLFHYPGLVLDEGQQLSELFGGVGSGPYYLWVTAHTPTAVSVSHS